RLKREARVWKSLIHQNIAPLLGLVSGDSGAGLVSPWYSHGNILQYLQKVSNAQREPLCEDVANGLRYLHEHVPSIVHWRLERGSILLTYHPSYIPSNPSSKANVLVGTEGHAALCDFGLSTVLDNSPTGFTSSAFGGTLRFMAPELLSEAEERRSIQSDVYAYACTYAEVCTHRAVAIFSDPHSLPLFVDHDWRPSIQLA
ncbi:hypothetical protein BS47DRAFT_1303155, partial [Hydnum rufescens UP504]